MEALVVQVENLKLKGTGPESPEFCSVMLNTTFTHMIQDVSFGGLPQEQVNEIFKDGRPFSHFIEHWLAANYPLIHVPGCKAYDHVDKVFQETFYDEKTFTKGGCKFVPSSMIGTGRKFDRVKFEAKTRKLIFSVVSNVAFPEIKVKFVKGTDLMEMYPSGKIPFGDHAKFFK
jgi:hypothetical protein